MHIQVVCCHPLTESFDHALFRTIVDTLQGNGHRVTATDLYREGFQPAMTVEERRTYMANGYDDSAVADHVRTLKSVDGLVLCFPHWWFAMPAMLKGWVDRVWGPGTAFVYDDRDGHLRPNLHNIRLFGVVTTFGLSWWMVRVFAGDPGRKVLVRGLRPLCSREATCFYLAQYGMDAATRSDREAFLEKVRRRVARI